MRTLDTAEISYLEYEPASKKPSFKGYVSPDITAFPDAGFILDDNTLVIDIDTLDHEVIESMLSEFGINTRTVWTSRGVHLYFDKPSGFNAPATYTCNLGFTVERKKRVGKNVSVTVRQNGKSREVENELTLEDLPDIFRPILSRGDGAKYNMSAIEPGQRNGAVFAYRKRIGKLPEADHMTRFMNAHIMPVGLPQGELEATLQSATKGNDEEETDPEFEKANEIIGALEVVQYGGQVYAKTSDDPKQWTARPDTIQRLIWDYCEGMTSRKESGVATSVKQRCPEVPDDTEFCVRFKNGILVDGRFMFADPGWFSPYYIDVEYDPACEPVKAVDDYLNDLTGGTDPTTGTPVDPDYKAFILEMMGHTLITSSETKKTLAKFFIMIGSGGNGKGTFIDVLTKILGDSNVSALEPADMDKLGYSGNLVGKLANTTDDMRNQPLDDDKLKIIKNITSGDRISVRNLYKESQDVRINATLIFTSNHVVKSFEKSDSFTRRIVWLEIKNKVVTPDPKFISRLTTPKALQYWIKLIIEAHSALVSRGRFNIPESVADYNKQYLRVNDSTLEFCELHDKDYFVGRTITDIHTEYSHWYYDILEGDGEPLKRKTLKEQLNKRFGLTNTRSRKIDGELGRYFE